VYIYIYVHACRKRTFEVRTLLYVFVSLLVLIYLCPSDEGVVVEGDKSE
jgi:hypothetical protein